MVSPRASPDCTSRRPSKIGPSCTGRYPTLLPRPMRDLVARAHDEHVSHGLVSANRAVVDEDRLVLMRPQEPQAREQPWREEAIAIVDQRAAAGGFRGGVGRV